MRLDGELVGRVEALRYESEPLSNAMARVMGVGCDTLEGKAQDGTVEHMRARAGYTERSDESTKKLISLLEKENERLTAEHENDLKRIEEKDRLIAKALESAHDLADQAHIIAGVAYENAGALESGGVNDDVLDVEPLPQKITFSDWFKYYRVGKRKA